MSTRLRAALLALALVAVLTIAAPGTMALVPADEPAPVVDDAHPLTPAPGLVEALEDPNATETTPDCVNGQDAGDGS